MHHRRVAGQLAAGSGSARALDSEPRAPHRPGLLSAAHLTQRGRRPLPPHLPRAPTRRRLAWVSWKPWTPPMSAEAAGVCMAPGSCPCPGVLVPMSVFGWWSRQLRPDVSSLFHHPPLGPARAPLVPLPASPPAGLAVYWSPHGGWCHLECFDPSSSPHPTPRHSPLFRVLAVGSSSRS